MKDKEEKATDVQLVN